MQVLTQRMEALERRLAERMVVDFVQAGEGEGRSPVEPEPKLAAEIVARRRLHGRYQRWRQMLKLLRSRNNLHASVEAQVNLEVLKPPTAISVARMNKFTLKLQAQEA